jgi:hypothetical protein
MKKSFFSLFLILILSVSSVLAAQEGASPHVSQIKAEPRNNLIRLTWVDSPDVRGPVYIFRSTRPFAGSVPANIRPVVVRYGEQYYIDDTDDLGNLYYFIAASDISGRRYDVIIPQVNSTNANLSEPSSPPPAAASDPESTAPAPVQGISNLRARLDGEKVLITFTTAGPRRNAVLYRSMQAVSKPQDLLNAVIVQSGMGSAFVDFPVPGIGWYYAVIYEDEISSGNMGIRPGINATVSAVIISGGESAQKALRPIPLPVMTLRNTMPDGYFLYDSSDIVPLSEESAKILKNIPMPSKEPLSLRKPRIFTIDLKAPSGGEDSALFQILNEFFVKWDWEGARVGLQHYLSLPRSKDVEARARFYLGQTLYFAGNYKGALFEFLSIRSIHPAEANLWIDAVLTAMVY